MTALPTIVWFEKTATYSSSVVGDKGTELGRLIQSGLPIPAGFVVSAHAFRSLLTPETKSRVADIFSLIDPQHPDAFKRASQQIQRFILRAPLSDDLALQLHDAYHQLGDNAFVAIRSSQTIPQLPNTHHTTLNVHGDSNVIETIRECWASLWSENLLLWLHQHAVHPNDIDMAVVVQRMVQSQKAGVLYTNNPETGNKHTVVIDAIWGLGEYYALHREQADTYEVEKSSGQPLQIIQRVQPAELVRKLGATKTYPTPAARKAHRKLTDDELAALTALGLRVQQLLFFPQNVEWAYEGEHLFVLETQPLTDHTLIETTQINQLKPIVYGTSISSGVASGTVRHCATAADCEHVTPGTIAVMQTLFPKSPKLRHAAGIIVDTAVYPQDVQHWGIPIIANAKCAMHVLKSGQEITLYGQKGVVYDGKLHSPESLTATPSPSVSQTTLLVSSGEPEKAERLAKLPVGGVGLLRAEYMMANIGVHPKQLIKKHKTELFKHLLEIGIERFAIAFGTRPVIYRFLDFTTQDFAALAGGEEFERSEDNPMLGYRGAFRQLTDPQMWTLELEVLTTLTKKYPQLHLMLPFVRSVEEYVLLNQQLKKYSLDTAASVQHWLMVDTPSVALQIEHFAQVGIDGFAIGARDLRMLMTGADISLTGEFAAMYAHDPGYLKMLRTIIQSAKQAKKPVMFCEHTIDQVVLSLLLEENIDAISVNEQQIDFVSHKLGLKGRH